MVETVFEHISSLLFGLCMMSYKAEDLKDQDGIGNGYNLRGGNMGQTKSR